jgi:competence protein ComEC
VSRSDRRSIAYVQDPKAFEEDCRRAAVVVTPLTAPPTCQASLILDRTFLRAHGATAVRLRDGSVTVRSARPDGPPPPWARPADNPDPPPARRQLPPQRPTRPSQPSIDLPDAIDEADAAAGR